MLAIRRAQTRYAARPRWSRAIACLHVLPYALPLIGRVRRHLRQTANRPKTSLPDFLGRLARSNGKATWWGFGPPLHPMACLTVTHRLVTRRQAHRCLPRALVLFGLLQRTNCPSVCFCLGVQGDAQQDRPFAHAWIEVDGQPFGEACNPHTTHRVLYRYSLPDPV